jgi:Zn-dependent peptidase ImmA (M78 family)
MEMGNWEMQAGDPSIFALALGFAANPHGDGDRATVEERASWGYFSIWVGGENLCAHAEQGEVLPSVHWYMISLIEWFAEHWDAMLHEERPALRNAGSSAAESAMRTKVPALSLKDVDEFRWLDEWTRWWSRHCIRAGTDGGVFPDLYFRRHRDLVEVSTGAEPPRDVPAHVYFLTPNRAHYVDPISVASSVHAVLTAATQELSRRLPDSDRVSRLATRLQDLLSADRAPQRMAWVVGLGDEFGRYLELRAEVAAALAAVDVDVRQSLTAPGRASDLLNYGTPPARLLYGAFSPSTTTADVMRIANRLVDNFVPDATSWLAALEIDELHSLDVTIRQLAPGEQGSRLGERACELLAASTESWVDVHKALAALGVRASQLELSDESIRAISVFGQTQRPHILRNLKTFWGTSRAVERFTLAHELCHLLLDREWGGELAVASGPWAPLAIEQRANAFAAAFLMPSWLLRTAIAGLDQPAVIDAASMATLAGQLRVSVSSLVDRLYNLGELTVEDRGRLRGYEP